jgi:integrase
MLKRQSRHDKEAMISSKEEIRLLLAHAPEDHRALITTAIFTGMRISELRGLAWSHVDFERRIISVQQRANKSNEIGSPKSKAGRRDIPMSPRVCTALREWRLQCPAGPHDLVFPNGAGNVRNYGNLLRRVFKPIQVKAGIVDAAGNAKYGFHALRHAAASMMIEQKWPAKKIQTILGHSSVVMTFDVYGHLFTRAEDDVELFEKMEEDLMAA